MVIGKVYLNWVTVVITGGHSNVIYIVFNSNV